MYLSLSVSSIAFLAFLDSSSLPLKNHSRMTSDDGGYTDTKTNVLSRYFMLRVSIRLQKWTGVKGRNGMQLQRRGDGSFMN